MSINSIDKTLERSYLQKWRFLIEEYHQIKAKRHPVFTKVGDFYRYHNIARQTFHRYYNRYRQCPEDASLLPQKRGPKWQARRPIPYIENQVIQARLRGNNRYEICEILRPKLKRHTPSPSGVYNILKRHNLNRLRPKMKQAKREIIKERAGELGHVDCHYLSKDLVLNSNKRYYLVAVVDGYSRAAWAELVEDIKSLSVMFACLKSFNLLSKEYAIQFEEVLTDNGAEFGGQAKMKKNEQPFERMLMELGIKHRFTRPYRPQTNGKVERFWRTLNDDLIDGTTFDNIEEFKDELMKYLIYYNEHRPHQALGGNTPLQQLAKNQQVE